MSTITSNAKPYTHTVFATARHADLYAKFRPILPGVVMDYVLANLRLHYEPHEWDIAIDVGCGGGQSTQVLAKYFKQVYGFDVSAAQIREALDSYHAHNVHFDVSIAESIPRIESNSCQLIIACLSAQWFDLPKFFAETRRVLAPNGIVALIGYTMFEPIDPDRPNDQTLTELMLGLRTDPVIAPYKLPNADAVDKRYRNISFPDYFEYIYKDNILSQIVICAQDIIGFIETWSPYQQMFKKSQSEANYFLKNFEQKLKSILTVDDLSEKRLLCNYRYYVAMGRKKPTT
ncbi:putative methyltransferase DDB_G0268948 [Oppia nitens]|uniref:putative methyltransferase DDB_G0268948 n=1 Tax=Oppia nitens TaxID=1686743 RepID=UPI0023DA9A0D|nr:putative methyltransferase DDB_G0268948 [Oppia nitens]